MVRVWWFEPTSATLWLDRELVLHQNEEQGPVVSFVHLEFVLHEFSFVLHEFSLVKHECSFVLLEFVLHNAACLTWEIPAHRRKTYGGKDIVVI